jgi:hypothetical protein
MSRYHLNTTITAPIRTHPCAVAQSGACFNAKCIVSEDHPCFEPPDTTGQVPAAVEPVTGAPASTEGGEHSASLLYGFDRTSGIFATVWVGGEIADDNITGGMSPDDLIGLALRYGLTIPQEHQINALMDLPF